MSDSKTKPRPSLGARIFRILSGYEIAVTCLSLLFLLTFFGTIEQKWFGLWATIHKYFDIESLYVIPTLGDGKVIFFPLPGAYWVIVVLGINMLCGAIIRARKGWKKFGVLLSHCSILFMLIAGAVSSVSKQEGHMRVLQGEKSDYAQKLFKHDIEVFKYDEKGDREAPAIVRSEHIKPLGAKDKLEATFEKFDFTLEVDKYLPVSSLSLDSPGSPAPEGVEVVDGFYIVETEKDIKTEERNMPGCYVSVKDKDGNLIQRLVLWAGNPYPVSFTHDGARYGVTYLMEVWPMPFMVDLHKTLGEYHPGTQIPSWFQSNITKIDGSSREEYEIVMNEPARHGGYTLYQAGYTAAAEGETPSSTFAIVNNPSDKWPEYALYASTVGLLIHFLIMLGRFAGRRPKKTAAAESASSVSSDPVPEVQPVATSYRGLRWGLVIVFLLGLFLIIGYGIRGIVPETEVREVEAYSPWSDEVVDVASAIPVQDGGRVKPLATYARFKMLSFHGALKMKVKSGGKVHKIGPVEWLLDCMFRPEIVDDLPIFRLDDSDILKPFNIETKKRRARLSFNDIQAGGSADEDGFQMLINRGRELLEKQEATGEDSLSDNEKKTVEFAQLALNYTGVRDSFDIIRDGLPKIDKSQLAYVNEEHLAMLDKVSDPSRFFYWLPLLDKVVNSTRRLETPEARQFEYELNRQVTFARYGAVMIPPQAADDEEWISLGTGVEQFLQGEFADPTVFFKDFRAIADIGDAAKKPNSEEFLEKLTTWKKDLNYRAELRNEGAKIDTEVTYYKRNYFIHALAWFILAFLVSALGWIVRDGKGGRVIQWITATIFTIGVVYLLGGIIHRFVITGRPPVSNLYDTIPFITAGAVIVLGISEFLTRRRILLSMGAALGVIGLFFAFRFELGDAKDNMDPLRAVLDSNYWLATHVVTITIGYCGGLVACFLSMVYAFLALAGVMKDPKAFQRFMTRTVYGITCFTLLFSLVGTVLGGIWANDSWGRFWGWDPKENGALLIVLWSLIILHGRLAGWTKNWGIHLMSILGGSVVVFSWWGVNMLEVGLHSYGFIEGASTVYYFYGATLVAFFVGVVAWAIERAQKQAKATDLK